MIDRTQHGESGRSQLGVNSPESSLCKVRRSAANPEDLAEPLNRSAETRFERHPASQRRSAPDDGEDLIKPIQDLLRWMLSGKPLQDLFG
jgi:hypothetical protein